MCRQVGSLIVPSDQALGLTSLLPLGPGFAIKDPTPGKEELQFASAVVRAVRAQP